MKKRIVISALAVVVLFTAACSGGASQTNTASKTAANIQSAVSEMSDISNETNDPLLPIGKMELKYAQMFAVDYLENGLSLVTIENEPDKFLIVPKDAKAPENLPADVKVIEQPVGNIYLAASALMDLFAEIDGLDSIFATSTTEKDWSLPVVKERLQNEDMLYVGKYSAPDFEALLSEGASLAIESTMIYHSPAIKEQLEALKIPVMVERSSYEAHPLGRMEWIKLCGLLIGKEKQAQEIFDEKSALLDSIVSDESTDKTAAFFYVSSNGYVNVRKPGDYISEMMRLAGGSYIFTSNDLNVDDTALSTMNMQFEAFYAKAKDADILIYNGTTVGNIETLNELKEKNKLFSEFRAVKNGNVWCTRENFYQQTSATADVISDFHIIFNGTDDMPKFLYRLE